MTELNHNEYICNDKNIEPPIKKRRTNVNRRAHNDESNNLRVSQRLNIDHS